MLFTQETNKKNGIEELKDRQSPKDEVFDALKVEKTFLFVLEIGKYEVIFLYEFFIGVSKFVVTLRLSGL